MINGYIVVREQRNIDPKFWVCTGEDDALKIANDVSSYWINRAKESFPEVEGHIDATLYGDYLFFNSLEDSFTVYVQTQAILESSEEANAN